MTDILFMLYLNALFFLCGAPFVEMLFPRELFRQRYFAAPAIGYGLLSIVITVMYRWGMAIRHISVFISALSVLIAVLMLMRAVRSRRSDGTSAVPSADATNVLLGIYVVCSLLMIAPKLVGGNQFAVFQGNQWDTFNYLNASVVYSKENYAAVKDATDEQLLANPLLSHGKTNSSLRPTVMMLFAAVGQPLRHLYHELYYPFLAVLLSQVVLITMFIMANVFPDASRASIGLASLVFPLGFWGQYVFDINSWSQTSSVAVLMLLFGLLLIVFSRGFSWTPWKMTAMVAISVSSALYLYPESLLFHAPALVTMFVVSGVLAYRRKSGYAASRYAALGFATGIAIGFLFFEGTIQFGIAQMRGQVLQEQYVEWWRFFTAYVFGRDGYNQNIIANTVDALAAFFGLYFMTPSPSVAGTATAFILRLLVAVVAAGLIMLLYRLARQAFARGGMTSEAYGKRELKRSRKKHGGIANAGGPSEDTSSSEQQRDALLSMVCFVVALICSAIPFFAEGNYWATGKAVSYLSPYLMVLIGAALVYWRQITNVFLRVVLALYVIVQLSAGIARIPSAGENHGVYYAFPYPSCQVPDLKKYVNWDINGLDPFIQPANSIIVDIRDRWLENYVMVYLYTRDKQFSTTQIVNSSYGAGRNIGKQSIPAKADLIITLDEQYRLKVLRNS